MGSGYRGGESFTPPPGWEFRGARAGNTRHAQADFSDFFESLFGHQARGAHHHSFQQRGEELNIKIPAGIMQGQQMRLTGQGMPGFNGGKNGDLYLEIHFQKHPRFIIDKKDIFLNLQVTPWEAALGEKIEVPTLGGAIAVTLPKHSQTGQKIRLKARGLPGDPAGDQYITLLVHIPEPKNDAQNALYEKMKAEMPFNPRESK